MSARWRRVRLGHPTALTAAAGLWLALVLAGIIVGDGNGSSIIGAASSVVAVYGFYVNQQKRNGGHK